MKKNYEKTIEVFLIIGIVFILEIILLFYLSNVKLLEYKVYSIILLEENDALLVVPKDEKSIEFLAKAVELNPNDVIAKFYLAYEYKQTNQDDMAIKWYNEVLKLNPDYSWAYYNMGIIYSQKGDYTNAVKYLEKTVLLNPADKEAVKLLVKIYSKNKKYTAAERQLRKTIHDLPNDADFYYLMAQIYKELKSNINYTKYLKYTIQKGATFSGNIEKVKLELASLDKNKTKTKISGKTKP